MQLDLKKYSELFRSWSALGFVILFLAPLLSISSPSFGGDCRLMFEPILTIETDTLGYGDDDFREIKDVGDQIIARYPPDKFYYLSAGQSLTALIAYFRARSIETAANLPLSSMRNKYAHEDQLKNGKLLGKLFDHFQRFVPSRKMLGKRKILLMDYSRAGYTISHASNYLTMYFQDPSVVVPLVLTADESRLIPKTSAFSKLIVPDRFGYYLEGQVYKYHSEYGFFRIDEHESEDVVPRPRFQYLIDNFKARLAHE